MRTKMSLTPFILFALTFILFSCTQIQVLASDTDSNIASDGAVLKIDNSYITIHTLQKPRNDNDSFVILFFGDGYTEDEQEQFLKDITTRAEALLQVEPFSTYSNKINMYAVSAISEESGASYMYGTHKNTFFHVGHYGNITSFVNNGSEKSSKIKTEIENKFLDAGAVVGTIHILSNSPERFGSSISPLFSFSSMSSDCSNGSAVIHEISHSIGRLKDEYGRVRDGSNASTSTSAETVPWNKLLGFRGIGATPNGNDPNGYIPSHSCIMKSLDNIKFCEVCKLEIALYLNSYLYTENSDKYYIANPDITTEHHYNTLGNDYEKHRVNNSILLRANNNTLEFRTIVQNFADIERHFRLTLAITDANGNNKYFSEDEFVIPPLPDKPFNYQYDSAKASLSVKIENVKGIVLGDKIHGQVIDCDTNRVVATNTTETDKKSVIRIHHKIKNSQGVISDMPKTYTTRVYIPTNSIYSLTPPNQLNGYSYIGNSLKINEIQINDESIDIDYYYSEKSDTAHLTTTVSDNGKKVTVTPHNIEKGSSVILAFYDDDLLQELKTFSYNMEYISYVSAKKYSSVKVMAWDNLNSQTPLCKSEHINIQ